MTLDELRSIVDKYQDSLKIKKGIVKFGESGPASMPIIHAIVAALAAQDERLQLLEKQIANH